MCVRLLNNDASCGQNREPQKLQMSANDPHGDIQLIGSGRALDERVKASSLIPGLLSLTCPNFSEQFFLFIQWE